MGIAKNLGWKLGSLLLAVLLWLAFSSAPLVVTTHTAPIVYSNLANGWMVAGNSPETVHLELRGPAGRLTVASLAETVVRFDLANVASSEDRTFTISESNLNLPPGVVFLRAVPSQLRLHLAHLAQKEVPVEVRLSGSPPAGYHLAGQSVSPGHLRIAGAEARVTSVTQVQTDPIDLRSLMQSGDHRVDAFVDDPQVHFESPPQVTVHLTIERTGK
ncbi:MAG TPA: CdaR family protein [Bryobacteraceae bacterium]|jgi:diadenylate cyclase|nr:CdaR family protein [Bryobacteraceae bacterium]